MSNAASSCRPVPIPPATAAAARTAVLSAVEAASELDEGATFEALAEAYWTAREERHSADARQCVEAVSRKLAEQAGNDGHAARRDI